jgi:DNA repair exonuclease SbcCD ATPase subunit
MLEVIKRLELIKSGIALGDEDIIELQIHKIRALATDETVTGILSSLDRHDYVLAISAIEVYIAKSTGIVPHVDKELQGLKLELKVLERKLQNLADKKNALNIALDEFNREYSIKLGPTIQKILDLREKILRQKILRKEQAFEARKREYHAAKEEKEKLRQSIAEIEAQLGRVEEFSDEYDELYEEYLTLKEDLAHKEDELQVKRKQAKEAKEALYGDADHEKYQDAKQESKTFQTGYEKVVSEAKPDLDEAQQKELVTLFRKACRLCHPDIVSEELKAKAHEIMSELNAARANRDLRRVKEILHSLQTGKSFSVASDTIFDKDLLRSKIQAIKETIRTLESEIQELENSEANTTISEFDDKDDYFESLKAELLEEYARLEEALKQLNSDACSVELEDVQNDDYKNFEDDMEQYNKMRAEEDSEDYWQTDF